MMSVSGNTVPDTGTMEELLRQINEKLDVMMQPEDTADQAETVSDNTVALLEKQVELQDTQIKINTLMSLIGLLALGIMIGLLLKPIARN